MNRSSPKPFLPILILFIVLNGFFVGGRNMLTRWQTDQNVLIIGNILLLVITLVSFLVAKQGLSNKNPHAFVRSVMGAIMIKMFIFIIAAFIYIAIYKRNLNKPALFTLMGLYLVYTFIEVSVLTKMLKQKNNE
jgi:Ca2+/Na+ antiporter